MNELERYIISCFGVAPGDLQAIVSFFHTQTLSKGDYFLKAEGQSDRLSFMHSGLMRVYAQTQNKEITQWISTPGYFVCDLSSFLFGNTARWNIQALADCELYSITRNDYRQLGTRIPQWHELEKLFLARCFATIEDRVFNLLSKTAEERYRLLVEQHRDLFNQVPLQYLASMLGMTPETLSRLRKKTIHS